MAEHKVELIDYLRVLWQRKWFILSGALTAALIALASSTYASKPYQVKPL